MSGRKPDKRELARMKVLSELGQSPTAIARSLGRSHHTVIKYLNSEVYNDPTIQKIIEQIKAKELQDLTLLGAKARKRLHEHLDRGDAPMIPVIAAMDRCFQQRRLLEGESTANISIYARLEEISKELDAERELLRYTEEILKGREEGVNPNAEG